MRIEIVEARLYHCGHLARAMRPAQIAGGRARGANPHRELVARFGASSYRRACLLDGRLAALGGVVGTQVESEGLIWLAIAAWATAHPRALLIAARQALDEIGRLKHRVGTLILAEDAASFRFAKRLGFNVRVDAETPFETVFMERAA